MHSPLTSFPTLWNRKLFGSWKETSIRIEMFFSLPRDYHDTYIFYPLWHGKPRSLKDPLHEYCRNVFSFTIRDEHCEIRSMSNLVHSICIGQRPLFFNFKLHNLDCRYPPYTDVFIYAPKFFLHFHFFLVFGIFWDKSL